MITSALIGASTNFFMFIFGKTENYLFMGILLLIGNTMFGYSIVMYNAYLPFLCKDHPDVRALIDQKEKAHKVVDKFKDVQDHVSNTGFLVGYASGVFLLIVCLGLSIMMAGTWSPLFIIRLCILIGGVWWFSFTIPVAIFLTERPGPPVPGGGGAMDLVILSFSSIIETA